MSQDPSFPLSTEEAASHFGVHSLPPAPFSWARSLIAWSLPPLSNVGDDARLGADGGGGGSDEKDGEGRVAVASP